jgi:phosphoribosyl-ATP pyrophosphohydrolase
MLLKDGSNDGMRKLMEESEEEVVADIRVHADALS